MKTETIYWKVHTPNLLKEMGNNNPSLACMRSPLMILADLLYQVGKRAAELNDPKLNELMMRLTIYESADPQSEHYDERLVSKYLDNGEDSKIKRNK